MNTLKIFLSLLPSFFFNLSNPVKKNQFESEVVNFDDIENLIDVNVADRSGEPNVEAHVG